ncbi:MAG: DUF1501 domain-containing protein [Planctomycetota bacterium]|nr:DUF1501 domain-containing protein [Planctomycetota bacterium]MDA1140651.1 DUF1501 domain-containing protein [Planctomycetota bacterium]
MNHPSSSLTRRDFFHWGVRGLGATAFANLLATESCAASLAHFAPRAKRAIHICLVGGLSHLDSFDYKPHLETVHGKSLQSDEQPDIFFGKVGLLRQSDFKFEQRGRSGLWVSDLFPHIARMADDLCVIRSMTSDSANHTPALFVANSGFQFNGFPTLGAWLSYGLGKDTDELPAYVVLPDERGDPNGGANSWTNGFLPAVSQGVKFASGELPVRDLFPAKAIPPEEEVAVRDMLRRSNQIHRERTGFEDMLSARMQSYELAARMQMSVPGVADISGESQDIRELYGFDDLATQSTALRCLLGRRLLERGVRFVQLFSGGPIAGSPRKSWDAHENVKQNHSVEARRIDKPVAGLLQDLKQRGMLDDTLVIFTTEFGRTPFAQSNANEVGPGRDHNKYGFSCWLAGAGTRGGFAFGNTDEIGWKAVENPMPWHDFHATVLAALGLDHEKLTYYHNGIQRRLTNVHGKVAWDLFA